eukprot:Rhum_TRINITY_DN16697_c0_g2::Rhum_TRINITY_DN16697_c0_g2_i1::g.164082::m.164082
MRENASFFLSESLNHGDVAVAHHAVCAVSRHVLDKALENRRLTRRRNLQGHVGNGAVAQPAEVLPAQRHTAEHRHAHEGLLHRQPLHDAGQRRTPPQVVHGRRAGVEVRGDGHGDAGGAQTLDGRRDVLKVHLRARQHDGDAAVLFHRRDTCVVQALEMVDGHGAHAGGGLRDAGVRDLLGMRLHEQPALLAGAQDALALLQREGALVRVHVDGVRHLGHQRQLLVDHLVHVRRAVLLELLRQRVRAEEGRRHAHHVLARARRLQHLQLVLRREPVAALDLDGRHAAVEHAAHARARNLRELLEGGGARVPYGAEDAAALLQDLRVVGAGDALAELLGARARVHRVRVGVHEARHADHAVAVDLRVRVGCPVGRAGVHDAAVGEGDGGVVDEAERRLVAETGVHRVQRRDVVHRHLRPRGTSRKRHPSLLEVCRVCGAQ